jgi:hypothetical protein
VGPCRLRRKVVLPHEAAVKSCGGRPEYVDESLFLDARRCNIVLAGFVEGNRAA